MILIRNYFRIIPFIFIFSFIYCAPTFGADVENPLLGVWKYKTTRPQKIPLVPIINFRSDGTLIFTVPTPVASQEIALPFGNAQYEYKDFSNTNNYKGRYEITKGYKSFQFSLVHRQRKPAGRYELVNYVNEPMIYRVSSTDMGRLLTIAATSLESSIGNVLTGRLGTYIELDEKELFNYHKLVKKFGIKDLQYAVEEELKKRTKVNWYTSEIIEAQGRGPSARIYINRLGKKTRIQDFNLTLGVTVLGVGDTVVWRPVFPRNDPNSALFKDKPGETIKVAFDISRLKRAPKDFVKINKTLNKFEREYIERVAKKSGCKVNGSKIKVEKLDVKHNLYTVNCNDGTIKVKCNTTRGQMTEWSRCRSL